MANLNIVDLPDNILERIFSNIDSDSLPKLTEVCSRFNNVIGSSTQLMDRFPRVEWIEENCKKLEIQPMLMSERKYRRMNIFDINLEPDLRNFLTKHATTLTTIRFSDCSFKSSELGSALLALAQSLSEIYFWFSKIDVDNEIAPIRFKQLTTLTLEYCDNSIFGFFTGATTVAYLKLFESLAEKETFSPFVLSLDGLKTLNIWCDDLDSTLFNDFIECHFRLTTLKIQTDELGDQPMSQEFWNFISMQRSSLTKLRLKCLDIDRLDILLSLNLQELSLDDCFLTRNSNPLGENISIRSLELDDIDYDDRIILCNIIEKCTRLKHIKLVSVYLTFEMAIAIRESNVETLILDRSDCFIIPIPSLKTLIVRNISEDHFLFTQARTNAARFIRVNLQLKNLTVPSRLSEEPVFARAVEKMSLEGLEYD